MLKDSVETPMDDTEASPDASAPSSGAKKKSKPTYGLSGPSALWRAAASKAKLPGSRVMVFEIPMLALADIATAFMVPFERLLAVLSNGRAFSPWGEEICQVIGQAVLHAHRDIKGSDGISQNGDLISIKSLTKQGVKIQMSVFTGAGRSCSMDQLRLSARHAQFHLIVDITDLSCLRVSALPQDLLLAWIDAGLLTPSGIGSPEEFYALIEATAGSGEMAEIDSKSLMESVREANRAKAASFLAASSRRAPLFAAPADSH